MSDNTVNLELIKQKIEEMKISDDSNINAIIRKIFSHMAEAIKDHTEKCYFDLENDVRISIDNKFFIKNPIICGLIDYDKKKMNSDGSYNYLFPINHIIYENLEKNTKECEEKDFYLEDISSFFGKIKYVGNEHVFINEDYFKMLEIIGNNQTETKLFTGKYTTEKGEIVDFKYKLEFDDNFIKVQNDIFTIVNRIYQMKYPVAYNPYARKYFQVIPVEDIPEKNKGIDYQYEKNGLKVIREEDARLMWNIKIEKTKIITCNKTNTYQGNDRFIYLFENEERQCNPDFVVYPIDRTTLVYDVKYKDDTLQITTNKSSDEFYKISFFPFDSIKAMDEWNELQRQNRIFSTFEPNICDFSYFLQSNRILAESDIEYAIRPFRKYKNIRCKVLPEMPENTKICCFQNNYECSVNKQRFSHIKNVYLRFYEDEDYFGNKINFLEDYISFVIHFLTYYYPEITWVGSR